MSPKPSWVALNASLLGEVSVDDVKHALLRPIEASGRKITPTALRVAAEGTKGYPFLVQLVGHQVWNVDRGSREITEEHAREGVEKAVRRVGRLVHEPAGGTVHRRPDLLGCDGRR